MSRMFSECESLKELDLSNYNTDNLTDMADMFNGCTLLTNLNISNFNMNKVKNMKGMLSNCSDELKNKIRKQNKNIKEEAFL